MAFIAIGFNGPLWLSGMYPPNQAVHDQTMPCIHFSCHHHHPTPGTAITAATSAYCIIPGKYLVFSCLWILTQTKPGTSSCEHWIWQQQQWIQWQQQWPICWQWTGGWAAAGTGCTQVSHHLDLPPTTHLIVCSQPHDMPCHWQAHHHPCTPVSVAMSALPLPLPSSFTSTTSVAMSVSPPPLLSHLPCWHHQLPAKQPPALFWNPTHAFLTTDPIPKLNCPHFDNHAPLKTHQHLFWTPCPFKNPTTPVWEPTGA